MARLLVRGLGRVAGRLPTILVWAGLAGLFVYGSAHGWKFTEPEPEKKGEEKDSPAEPGTFTRYFQAIPGDIPVQVAHDPAHCPVFETNRFKAPEAGAAVVGTCAWFDPKPLKLESADAAELAGLTTARAGYTLVSTTVTAHGDVQQDPTAVAKVSPRVGGMLFDLEKELGDPVRAGELLALVESVDVGRAKAAYLTAKVHAESREQVRASLTPSVSPPRSIVEAEAAARDARAGLYSARQTMANLGFPLLTTAEEASPDDVLTRELMLTGIPFGKRLTLLAAARTGRPLTANLLPVFSPLAGVVVRRAGVVGETVAAQQVVYEVGDPTRVYVFLEVRQEDMARVAVGQTLTFELEGGAGVPPVAGAVDWISPTVDEKTRTVRVPGKIPNPGGVLRSGAFGGGTITVEAGRRTLTVPRAAVHWEGCSHVVFVRTGGGPAEYWPRRVRLGTRSGDVVEITGGLAEGEEVVVTGSQALKGELLKARIGEAE